MKQLTALLLLIAASFALTAQTISLYFPHFAGQEYDFYVFEGTKNDTLQRGAIPEDGHLSLNVSGGEYRGMARWLLRNGGGLDFVINGEDFSVSCTEAVPSDDNIVYSGSKENDFFREYFFRQQSIFQKMDALNMGLEAYAKEQNNPIYPLLTAEKSKQQQAFASFAQETTQTTFYAAQFRRFGDFLNSYPLYILHGSSEADQQKYMDDRRRYVMEELDMEALYSSGLWRDVIASIRSEYETETDYVSVMQEKLKQTQSQQVYERLAGDLISLCEQYNWQQPQESLLIFLYNEGRIKEPTGKLKTYLNILKLKKGSKAPVLSDGKKLKNTVLLFYESGCGHCDETINELKASYQDLKAKGYEVISISSDVDQKIHESYSNMFPWAQKLCDLQGLQGADFQNYGILGTPTLFLVDRKGVIQGRYARLQDMEL